jgi:BetI-type transcriptional repressor, C-terminal
VVQLIPLDERRQREGASMLAYVVGGMRDDEIDERMRSGMAQLRQFVAGHVETTGIEPDAAAAAETLLALADGLAAGVLGGYLMPDRALELLDAHLDRIFGPA